MAVEERVGSSKTKILFEFVGVAVGVLLAIIAIVSFLEKQFSLSILGDKIFSFALLLAVSISSAMFVVHYRHSGLRKSPTADQRLEGSLLDSIEKAYKEQKWQEVIKIGSVLSRPLWLTGNYELRVKIGEYVESAAAFSKEDRIQASALIDDLGWTNVVLGDLGKAKSNIEHGIKIAEGMKDYYLASKAYRHLSGIAERKKNYEEAKAMIEMARRTLSHIPEGKERKELEAGLLFSSAMLEMDQGKWNDALSNLRGAKEIYRDIKDEDREAKIYALEGNCHLSLGNIDEALDSFRDGLAIAEERCRKDSIVSNNLGIGRAYEMLGNPRKAKEHFDLALRLAKEIKDQASIDDLEKELKKIDRKG